MMNYSKMGLKSLPISLVHTSIQQRWKKMTSGAGISPKKFAHGLLSETTVLFRAPPPILPPKNIQ